MKFKRIIPETPSRILVLDLAMIGDLVCAIPALKAIAAQYPDAEIHVLASDTSAQVLKYVPEISGIIPVSKKKVFGNPMELFATAKSLKKNRYDAAFLFHNSIGSALIAWLAGIPHRMGYATEMRSNLLTAPLAPPAERLHLTDERTNLLRRLGIPARNLPPELEIDEGKVKEICSRLLPEFDFSRKLLLIAVGSTWPTKIWPAERIQAFLNKLPVGSCSAAIIGGPGEEQLAEGLSSLSVPVYNLAGKTTLEELIHLIAKCDLLITPDNGPMHIAEALDKNVIALFGPTDPKLCGMLHSKAVHIQPDSPCKCCWEKKCNYRTFCMNEIGEQDVLKIALQILGAVPSNGPGESA